MQDPAKERKRKLYESLRRSILTMQLSPGGDLDETRLAREFGLSRTPLREVFQQLAGEGYVRLTANRGARVVDMGHKTLRDFFLVAPMIYGAVSRLAAQNARPDQIGALKDAQKAFRNALRSGSIEDRTLANYRFHAIIGEMADSDFLMPSLNRLLIDHARIGMTFYHPRNNDMVDNLAKAGEQHDLFIESIENGDDDAAAGLADTHWNLSRNQIEMFVMPSALESPLGGARQVKTA